MGAIVLSMLEVMRRPECRVKLIVSHTLNIIYLRKGNRGTLIKLLNMKTKSPKTMLEDSKKESYAKPEVNIINLEPEGAILVSSDPTGSGEDMPWRY